MKKFAAISLLLLLLFNFIGYRLLFYALQQTAEKSIVTRIDKEEYNDAELVTLTVPLAMPYLQDSKDFERKDGEITIDSKVYHYVKQKISQGNLVLLCLPDDRKTHLQNAKDDFFRLANELQNNTSSSKQSGENSHIIKLVMSDYEELQISSVDLYSTSINISLSIDVFFGIQKGEGIMPEQPPEA